MAKESLVPAQIEAAYTLQSMGGEDPVWYRRAIGGGGTQLRYLWGWGQIARKFSRYVSKGGIHRDIFHEARYNLALCRFELALSKTKKDERTALLERAAKDILVVQRSYPEMGGNKWRKKYNELLKKIQKLRGQQPVGLPRIEEG
jgi:hypothetical protein